MDVWIEFAICVASVTAAIIIAKIFFTLWRLFEKRVHPEMFERDKVNSALEAAFGNIKGKNVDVYLRNGEIIKQHKYVKASCLRAGQIDEHPIVYFELIDSEEKTVYIAVADAWKIETATKA
jgi:hypothetical protein